MSTLNVTTIQNLSTLTASGQVSVGGNLLMNSGYGSAATAYGCRAWVNFDGQGTYSPNPSTSKIRASGNVSSIYDNGTGNYTLNFTTAMPDANFAYTCSVGDSDHSTYARALSFISSTASTLQVLAEASNGSNYDEDQINIAIFR